VRHCLCATLEQMIAQASDPRSHLLKRLFNESVLEYARWVGGRERLSPDVYRGFFVSVDPQRYLLLLALTYLPTSLQQYVRRIVLRTREVTTRSRLRH
jgi:hypothetical protein